MITKGVLLNNFNWSSGLILKAKTFISLSSGTSIHLVLLLVKNFLY